MEESWWLCSKLFLYPQTLIRFLYWLWSGTHHLMGFEESFCFGWRTSETLQKCFLCYENMRFWLSTVIVLHWVDFCVQRKYVNNSAKFYQEEKPWSGCRMGTKPPGGRGEWTIQQLSEWQYLGFCSWLGKRPDEKHLSSSLASSIGFFRNWKNREKGRIQ